MTRQLKVVAGGTDSCESPLSQRTDTLKAAASDWADTLKDSVRGQLVEKGAKTEAYIRKHPLRFIAGGCCLGLAAGWFLGHQLRKKK